MNVRRLVLASQSPRRKQILTISGYEFEVLPTQISEIPDENLNLTSKIRQLASQKAHACLKMRKPLKELGILVLGADTVVVLSDQILGKPKDENEARSFLRRLSNSTHDVITAVSLVDEPTGREAQGHAITHVTFRTLSDAEIDSYIKTGEPFDKAGGYGIQGAASDFIKRIEGPYDSVVGLPMKTVEAAIAELGVEVERRNRDIENRFSKVRSDILEAVAQAKRIPGSARLVAVSKTHPATSVVDAWKTGQRIFGENYVQEAVDKMADVDELVRAISEGTRKDPIEWHMIGSLQSKKVKDVVGKFALIHSVDRISLANEIDKRARERGIRQRCLLQVNIGDESTKRGISKKEFLDLLQSVVKLGGVQVVGMMALPPLETNLLKARKTFQELRDLFEQARESLPENLRQDFVELSLGTTHDYQLAIEYGATFLRIGTALFGERT